MNFFPGDRILIQGKSGGGKSTIFKLLTGFLKPTNGKILYNNLKLDQNLFYKIRSNISYISADSHIFRGSIRENLHLTGNYSEKEIESAIIKSKLDSVIDKINGGIDGYIGENASKLSLGERQRILLTQLFLQKSTILFLDEATSNLDIEFELDIIDSLFNNLNKNSILFFIAHKQPRNAKFNKHYILRNGRLVLNK